MPKASDGTPFHSLSRVKAYEGSKSGGTIAEKQKPAAKGHEPAGMNHPDPTEASIEDHVMEHGPAHKVEYHHDKASNTHHVTSHHGDGAEHEQHHSRHKNAGAAHEHMGKAMGEGADEEDETPDNEEPETGDGEQDGGGRIPGMSEEE